MGSYDDWWRDFFHGLGSEFIMLARTPDQTRHEVDLIMNLVGLHPGDRVLDVPCGAGRHSLELARRGIQVTGLDLSEPLLRAAREVASHEGLEVEFIEGDMRELPWEGEFDTAICLWTSIGYFDEEGDLGFLRGVRDALVPGGGFLIETISLETLLTDFHGTDEYDLGDLHVLERRRYDPEAGRMETEFALSRGEHSETKGTSIRVYTCRELVGLLREAGFEDPRGLDPATSEPFGLGARRLCVIAKRP